MRRILIFLIPAVSLWSFGLLYAFHTDVKSRHQRLISEAHVAETLLYYIEGRNGLALKVGLEKLRKSAGYTSLRLCHRGKLLFAAGEASESVCEPNRSLFVESWQKSVELKSRRDLGYQIFAETRVFTLISTLMFFLLAISLMGGIFFLISFLHQYARVAFRAKKSLDPEGRLRDNGPLSTSP